MYSTVSSTAALVDPLLVGTSGSSAMRFKELWSLVWGPVFQELSQVPFY